MAVRLAARPASPNWAAATAATAAADASAVAAAAAGTLAAAASRDAASAMLATRLAVMLPHAAQQATTGTLRDRLTGHLYRMAFRQRRWPMCVMQAAPRPSYPSAAGSTGRSHKMQTKTQQTPESRMCAVGLITWSSQQTQACCSAHRPSEKRCKAAVASNDVPAAFQSSPEVPQCNMHGHIHMIYTNLSEARWQVRLFRDHRALQGDCHQNATSCTATAEHRSCGC